MMALNSSAHIQPWTGASLCGRVGCRLSDMSNVFARPRLPSTWGLANAPAAGRDSADPSAPASPTQPMPAAAAKAGPVPGSAPVVCEADARASAPEDPRAAHGAAPLAREAHAQAQALDAVPGAAGAALQQARRRAGPGDLLAAGALRALARQAQEPAVRGSQAPSRGDGAAAVRPAGQRGAAAAAARDGEWGGGEWAPNQAVFGDVLAALLPCAVAAPDAAAAGKALGNGTVGLTASQRSRTGPAAAAAQAAAQPAAATNEAEDEDDEHTLAVLELDRLLRLSERAAAKQTSRAAPPVFPVEPTAGAGGQGPAGQGAGGGSDGSGGAEDKLAFFRNAALGGTGDGAGRAAPSASAILLQAQALFVSSLPGGAGAQARPAAPAAFSPSSAQAQALLRNAVPGGLHETEFVDPATPVAEQAPALFSNALPVEAGAAGKAVPPDSSPAASAPAHQRARRAAARVRFSLGREDAQDAPAEALDSAPGWWASSGGAGLSSGDEALGANARAGGQDPSSNPTPNPGQQPGLLSLDRLPPRRRPRPPPQQGAPVAPNQAPYETLAPEQPGTAAGAPGSSAPPARPRRPGKPRHRVQRDGARRGTPRMADSLLAVWRAAGGLDDPSFGPNSPDAGAGRGLANGVGADAADAQDAYVSGEGDRGGCAANGALAAGVALLRRRFMGLDDVIAEALLKVPVLLSKAPETAAHHARVVALSPTLT